MKTKSRKRSFSIDRAKPEIILQSITDICTYILQYLDNRELYKCKSVCSFWKEIVENIMRYRVIIITKKFPKSFLKETIVRPEILLPYIKQDRTNTQFIAEFMNTLLHCSCQKLQFMSKDYNLGIEKAHVRLHYSLRSLENIPPSKIAIFPIFSGMQINRFSISRKDIHDSLESGIWSIAKIIKVPEEELKCVLWFVDGRVEGEFLKMIPLCATAGLSDVHKKASIYKAITFSGKRLNALSICVPEPYYKSFTKDQFMRFKRYNINQNKCVSFIFGVCPCKCFMPYILSTFEEVFPEVPVLHYSDSECFGINYVCNLDGNDCIDQSIVRRTYPQGAIMALVWFN